MEKSNRYVLSEDCVIDLDSRTVTAYREVKKLTQTEFKFLTCLLENPNKVVTKDILLAKVWGDAYYTAENSHQRIRDTVKFLRKKCPPLRTLLEVSRGDDDNGGYRIIYNGPPEAEDIQLTAGLPHILTTSAVAFADEDVVIHRETEIHEIESLLSTKKNVLISGFGGIGKTSVARLLYFHLEKQFDHVGWINYRRNLHSSILSDFILPEEIKNIEDYRVRWEKISNLLKNISQKVLLIIDNVDVDSSNCQDPHGDLSFQELSGCPNVSVLLTSRLSDLQGYATYPLEQLSPKACEDLFYHYYKSADNGEKQGKQGELEVVRTLIRYAGYHSFAVELLARSAKYASSLEEYADRINASGFQFPSLKIRTGYQNLYGNAAMQLRKLFNLKMRSLLEQQILMDFSVIPSMGISLPEAKQWLGYLISDMDRLITEGWLQFRGGIVSMHPLVLESVRIDHQNGKAPEGTAASIIECILTDRFFVDLGYSQEDAISNYFEGLIDSLNDSEEKKTIWNDSFPEMLAALAGPRTRQYEIAIYALQRLPLKEDERFVSIQMRLCLFAVQTLVRFDIACDHYQKGLSVYQGLSAKQINKAEVDQAHHVLEGQADQCIWLGRFEMERQDLESASFLLENGLLIRKALVDKNLPDTQRKLAWAFYHLGLLVYSMGDRYAEAQQYLESALQIQKALATEAPEEYATEIAGICFLLANCCRGQNQPEEAEMYLQESLWVLQQAESTRPGQYLLNMAACCAFIAYYYKYEAVDGADAEALLNRVNTIVDMQDNQRNLFSQAIVNLFPHVKRFASMSGLKSNTYNACTLLRKSVALMMGSSQMNGAYELGLREAGETLVVLLLAITDRRGLEVHCLGRRTSSDGLEHWISDDEEFRRLAETNRKAEAKE